MQQTFEESNTITKPMVAKWEMSPSPAISDCFPTYASTRPPSEFASDFGSDSETEDECCASSQCHPLAGILVEASEVQSESHRYSNVKVRSAATSIRSWCVVSSRIAGVLREAEAELEAECEAWRHIGVRLSRVFEDACSAAESEIDDEFASAGSR